MIIGIGTDIVEIERVKKAVDKWGERFLNKIYTEKEITYCYQKRDFVTHLAGRFAAKEAVIKAFGGINKKLHPTSKDTLAFKEIEISNDDYGMPFVNLVISSHNIEEMDLLIHLTLSHEKKYAIATVIIEKKDS